MYTIPLYRIKEELKDIFATRHQKLVPSLLKRTFFSKKYNYPHNLLYYKKIHSIMIVFNAKSLRFLPSPISLDENMRFS